MDRQLVSVVAPVYNEDELIGEFIRRTGAVLDSLAAQYRFEIVLVDDGSTDGTLAVMKSLLAAERRLRVIELRCNVGQTSAIQAGLDAARGEIIITLDADLQHFPEEIPDFLGKLAEGFDMVCGWRHQRAEGIIRRWPSRAANLLIRRIARLQIHDFGTTFRAYRTELVRDLRLYGESHRFIPALGQILGGRITEIPIKNIDRPKGKSKYGIGRTTGVFLDLFVLFFFVRYLDRPMRAFGKLALWSFGLGFAIMTSLVAGAYILQVHMVKQHPGWFILAALLMLSGVQLLLTGILAEILIRIHFEQGDRRVYQIRREWGGEDAAAVNR